MNLTVILAQAGGLQSVTRYSGLSEGARSQPARK